MEDALDRLASELFRMFARFEYALKAAGFHRGDGVAKADWTTFAEPARAVLDAPSGDELKAAVEYLLDHPPRKQCVVNGVLVWQDSRPDAVSQADLVLHYVRRVRNNLFHGGKFNGHWLEPERSEALLRHSLVILNACLDASPEVRQAYGD